MKIGNNPELPGAAAQAAGAVRQSAKPTALAGEALGRAATAPSAAASAGVPVTLSRAAQTMAPASRTQGEFDANKVKAMRAAIEGGTFKVNAGAIADKLLTNAQEVLLSRSQD